MVHFTYVFFVPEATKDRKIVKPVVICIMVAAVAVEVAVEAAAAVVGERRCSSGGSSGD